MPAIPMVRERPVLQLGLEALAFASPPSTEFE